MLDFDTKTGETVFGNHSKNKHETQKTHAAAPNKAEHNAQETRKPVEGVQQSESAAAATESKSAATEEQSTAAELEAGTTAVAAPDPSAEKIAQLGAELESARQQLKANDDKYLRLLAEFDNYKRRTSREYEQLVESANAGIMKDMIPVREDFERALKAGREASTVDSVLEGMRLMFVRFDTILSKHGLEPFGVEGEAFDPVFHDAMLRMPHTSVAEDGLAEVIERGYRLKGQVIKHARVIVSAGAAPQEASAETEDSAAGAADTTQGEHNG